MQARIIAQPTSRACLCIEWEGEWDGETGRWLWNADTELHLTSTLRYYLQMYAQIQQHLKEV